MKNNEKGVRYKNELLFIFRGPGAGNIQGSLAIRLSTGLVNPSDATGLDLYAMEYRLRVYGVESCAKRILSSEKGRRETSRLDCMQPWY